MAEEHQPPSAPASPAGPSAPSVPLLLRVSPWNRGCSRLLSGSSLLLHQLPPSSRRPMEHSTGLNLPSGPRPPKQTPIRKSTKEFSLQKGHRKNYERGKLQGWERLSGKSSSSEPDLIYISMKTWVNHFRDFRNVLINLSQRGVPRDTFSLWGCCPSAWGVQAHSLTPRQRHAISRLPSPPRLLSWT